MQRHTLLYKNLNKSAMHAVISLLLKSRKFWRYLLLTSSMLLHDVILTSNCCQRYTECLITTLFQQDSAPAHCAVHVQQLNCCVKNAKLPCAQSVASKAPNSSDLSPVDYEMWAVMQRCVYHRQIHSVDEFKRWLNDVWCGLEQSIYYKATDQWRGRHLACVMLKEDILSTGCELAMLILSISVTFSVTC